MTRELTLVSYNIHSGVGSDRRFDLQRIAAVLRETNPDIAALQEVGDFRGRVPRTLPEDLAGMLGLHMAFGPNVIVGDGRYGNAILSRCPIIRSRNYDLSVPNCEPRGALRCDVDLGEDGPLHVFCVHLGLSPRERRAQEGLLLSADILRDAARRDPLVVCGDFNYWSNRRVPGMTRGAVHDVALLLRRWDKTFHSRFPFSRLDRVYVDAGVRPQSLRAHRSPLAALASDHLPLVMRFFAIPRAATGSEAPPVELIG